MPPYHRLQQYAIAISIASILYNGAEGGVSIGFGSEDGSRSLVFFGVQSGIEVASAIIVVWRFRRIAKPGEESAATISSADLRVERIGTWSIGVLLALLALATEITAIVNLVLHLEPDSSSASLIISASALVIMILIWLPKRYLARTLNSSTMAGEAACSLSCIQITIVLFVGSLVFRLWKGGWWIDSATSLILGLLFARESYKMITWVRDPEFDGGCCSDCRAPRIDRNAELGEQYRDLCDCCLERDECKLAQQCKCEAPSDTSLPCCKPVSLEGGKCCTHKIIQGPKPTTPAQAAPGGCQDNSCCAEPIPDPKANNCSCCAGSELAVETQSQESFGCQENCCKNEVPVSKSGGSCCNTEGDCTKKEVSRDTCKAGCCAS